MSALRNVYGCSDAIPCGPEIVRGDVSGKEVILTFDHTDELKQISEENAFYLAGDDGEFFPAEKVEIDGDTVKISSSAVDAPAAVRYAWADNPYPVLSDASGIPAAPFQLVLSGKGEK
jgi:sialate O-acetylesterase